MDELFADCDVPGDGNLPPLERVKRLWELHNGDLDELWEAVSMPEPETIAQAEEETVARKLEAAKNCDLMQWLRRIVDSQS